MPPPVVINQFDLDSMREIKRAIVRLRGMIRDLETQLPRSSLASEPPVAYLAKPSESQVAALTVESDGDELPGAGTVKLYRRDGSANDKLLLTTLEQDIVNAWAIIPAHHKFLIVRAMTGEWLPIAPELEKGILDGSLSHSGTATASLWAKNSAGTEADTGNDLTVSGWMLPSGQSLASGSKVFIGRVGNTWYAISANACPS